MIANKIKRDPVLYNTCFQTGRCLCSKSKAHIKIFTLSLSISSLISSGVLSLIILCYGAGLQYIYYLLIVIYIIYSTFYSTLDSLYILLIC